MKLPVPKDPLLPPPALWKLLVVAGGGGGTPTKRGSLAARRMAEEVDWVVSEDIRSEPRRRPEARESEWPSERLCRLPMALKRRAPAEVIELAARSWASWQQGRERRRGACSASNTNRMYIGPGWSSAGSEEVNNAR